MNHVLRRALRISTFDRPTARNLIFDSDATGDAVLLVAAIEGVITLGAMLLGGGFNLILLIQSMILGIAGWLVLSAATWFMGTRLLKGSGQIEAMFRVTGFGRLPLLLGLGAAFGFQALNWIGFVWHLAVVVMAAGVVLGLELKEALAAMVLGAALVLVIQLIFRAAFFRI